MPLKLIPSRKVGIQLFSPQLWVNSRADWFSSALMRQLVLEKENFEFKPVKLHLKIDLVSYPARAEGLVNMDMPLKLSGLSVRQWLCRSGFNPRSNHTKDSKVVLDDTLLNIQYYKVRIKGKVEQSRKRSSAIPNTSVEYLLKRKSSSRPRLKLPTLLSYHHQEPLLQREDVMFTSYLV